MAANLLLLVLVGLILATQFDTLAAIRLRGWIGMGLLFFASLGIGWLCGGKDIAIRKALAVTTAARNAAVGLVIVNSNFPETAAVTAVVAYALVSILGTFACAVLMGKFTRAEG
jgi:BASS family bile acid:Na+ symporter